MPESETRINIAVQEEVLKGITKEVDSIKSRMDTLSNNITLALTEMKISQVEMKATSEKVSAVNEKVECLKHDHIDPIKTKQDELSMNIKAMRWVAGIFFIGLVYALIDKFMALI